MDIGLRVVEWPLSPYATALAAGALVGFCVALWKVSSGSGEDSTDEPSGGSDREVPSVGKTVRNTLTTDSKGRSVSNSRRHAEEKLGKTCSKDRSVGKTVRNAHEASVGNDSKCLTDSKSVRNDSKCLAVSKFVRSAYETSGGTDSGDLDPPKEKEDGGKKAKDKEDSKRTADLPDVRPPDGQGLAGAFGAIPRTVQRPPGSPLFADLRRRFAGGQNKAWREIGPASCSFSCFYQQSQQLFGRQRQQPSSSLDARFVLNVSPFLSQYLRGFCRNPNQPFPGSPRKRGLFDGGFDVSINPEILKDRPLTRTALRLTLEDHLHKILGEREDAFESRRAIRTSGDRKEEEEGAIPAIQFDKDSSDSETEQQLSEQSSAEVSPNLLSEDSSLWDSGYCDRSSQDERWNLQKESDDEILTTPPLACGGSGVYSSSDSSDTDTVLYVGKASKKADRKAPRSTATTDVVHDEVLLNVTDLEGRNIEENNARSFITDSNELEISSLCADEVHGDIFALNVASNVDDEKIEEIVCYTRSPLTTDSNQSETMTDVTDPESYGGGAEMNSAGENDSGIHSGSQMPSTSALEISDSDINESIVQLSSLVRSLDLEAAQKAHCLSYEKDGQVCEDDRERSPDEAFGGDDFKLGNDAADADLSREEIIDELGLGKVRENALAEETDGEERRGNINVSRNCRGLVSGGGSDRNEPEEDKAPGIIQSDDSEENGAQQNTEFQNPAPHKTPDPGETGTDDPLLTPELENTRSAGDVGASRDPAEGAGRERRTRARQMDRGTGAVESSLTVVSRLALDGWPGDDPPRMSVRTTVSSEERCPSDRLESFRIDDEFETFATTLVSSQFDSPSGSLPSSPRVERLKGLIHRDEERRSRARPSQAEELEGEWDRLLRGVLASVSELERWELQRRRRGGDVTEDAEERRHPPRSGESPLAMEEEEAPPRPAAKGETPTKVKSLRFKLDPDVFDVPSDESFYDEDEPVRLVSVRASVVPAAQRQVARPVGIDLHVRLTEERPPAHQSKRSHAGSSASPAQAKRRSPVSERGWCQELSPVTENVDWRESFSTVVVNGKGGVVNGEEKSTKPVPNGILKTPSPRSEPPASAESPNPFKDNTDGAASPVPAKRATVKPALNGSVQIKKPTAKPQLNGVGVQMKKPIVKPELNGTVSSPWKAPEKKLLSRKKFEPDPEAVERITGYKSALSKPPLPPPIADKAAALKIATIKKAELARKQYLDSSKAALVSAGRADQKFRQFVSQAQEERVKLVTSVPDLAAIERAVGEQWRRERGSTESPRESPLKEEVARSGSRSPSRGSTPDDQWASYVQSCRRHLERRSQSMTYLETNVDVIPVLDEDDKCASTGALDESDELQLQDPDDSFDLDRDPDPDDSGRARSEHELRVERSLRSLPLPDWYKKCDKPKSGFLLGSSASREKKGGWAAAKSLASSTSSLASCGLTRRGPVRSLRSSRENIPWSRTTSSSPDGPTLSLALARAFREPYLGWRARTPTSSGVSSSPRASPPSWGGAASTTDEDEGVNGVSFDGEDAFVRTTSSEEDKKDPLSFDSEDDRKEEPLSLDDTGADAVTVSMDTTTNDPVVKLTCGEDTCDDINNMSMDTCELFDAPSAAEQQQQRCINIVSAASDTGNSIDNLSTDTNTENRMAKEQFSHSQSGVQHRQPVDGRQRGGPPGDAVLALQPDTGNSVGNLSTDANTESRKAKRFSYSQSIRRSEWESRGVGKGAKSPERQRIVWIESSFVGARTTTSIMVLPDECGRGGQKGSDGVQERPASR